MCVTQRFSKFVCVQKHFIDGKHNFRINTNRLAFGVISCDIIACNESHASIPVALPLKELSPSALPPNDTQQKQAYD